MLPADKGRVTVVMDKTDYNDKMDSLVNDKQTYEVLKTVPTIVTAHIFCACRGSCAPRRRNVQHTGHADWFCLL